MKYETIQILKQGSGTIVNTTAATVLKPVHRSCGYGAFETGIVHLTRTAAVEHAGSGMRINAVALSGTRTPMLETLLVSRPNVERRPYPIGRMAEPEAIAEAVVWLCSDVASFAVGSSLVMDGGYSIPLERHLPCSQWYNVMQKIRSKTSHKI
jgi:NAD(P)-dependent dehydrogenase (short-subunit alcohol dehydrogenase family)